jgi:integrase
MDAGSSTLRAFFDALYAPCFLTDARPSTIDEYQQLLRLWEQNTADPPLAAIDVLRLAHFKAALLQRRGRRRGTSSSKHTVNKHLRTLDALLAKAGPPSHHNRDALGILPRAPWVAQCKAPRPRPRPPTSADLSVLYRACAAATLPRRVDVLPAAWWRALLVVVFNIGLRREALFNLRWDHINTDDHLLHVEWAHDKALGERWKPLNDVALKHLAAIRTDRTHVFAFPHSLTSYYRAWHQIQTAAGLPPAKHFHVHDLKKACGTAYARIADPWVVQQMLDHSTLHTARHYVAAGDDELRAAAQRLPQPDAFRDGARQLSLFE